MPPGEKLVKHDSEGVNVARSSNRFALHLFGAGIAWRQGAEHRQRPFKSAGDTIRIQDFGNTEIQQLRYTLCSHKNVAGLDITVNDQMLMGVLHRRTYLQKQLQPLHSRQPVAGAIFVNGSPLNQFHREIRHAVFCGAAIEETGDVGMLDAG